MESRQQQRVIEGEWKEQIERRERVRRYLVLSVLCSSCLYSRILNLLGKRKRCKEYCSVVLRHECTYLRTYSQA